MIYSYASAMTGFRGELPEGFPEWPRTTKSLTSTPRRGYPWAVLRRGKTVWNRVSLSNPGLDWWLENCYDPSLILSVAPEDDWDLMRIYERLKGRHLAGLEINLSCPNYHELKISILSEDHWQDSPKDIPLTIKVGVEQDVGWMDYHWDRISRVTINSVPWLVGAVSGKAAQARNWKLLRELNERFDRRKRIGLNPKTPSKPRIVGCSITCAEDVKILEALGIEEIALGTVCFTNPSFVKTLQPGDLQV